MDSAPVRPYLVPAIEPVPIRAFRAVMHDVLDLFVIPAADAFEDFDALAACHPGLDREHLRAFVAAAERVFLDVLHGHVPPIPGGDHLREPCH